MPHRAAGEHIPGGLFFGGEPPCNIYPDNLTAKAMLWLWELRDVGVIGVGLLVSILALTQTGIFIPLVLTAVYAFLSIRFDGTSILDFIRYAIAFLITKQQFYEWRM